MLKDRVGNELELGDLVEVLVGGVRMFGRVGEISRGGIIRGQRAGKDQITAGQLVVQLNHFTFAFDPTAEGIGDILKVVDPEPAEREKFLQLRQSIAGKLKLQ